MCLIVLLLLLSLIQTQFYYSWASRPIEWWGSYNRCLYPMLLLSLVFIQEPNSMCFLIFHSEFSTPSQVETPSLFSFNFHTWHLLDSFCGLPQWLSSKESAYNAKVAGSVSESGRYSLQDSCPENPHGQRSLAGYSPWGHKELDTMAWLSTAQHSKSFYPISQ